MIQPTTFSSLSMKAKLLVLCCSLLVMGMATASAHLWPRATPLAITPPSATQMQQEDVAEAILLTIRATGFEPAEATLPAGKYLLVVQNRSGLTEVTLRLEEESRGRLLEIIIPKGKLDWRGRLELMPGNYTLIETNHSEWLCRITITP